MADWIFGAVERGRREGATFVAILSGGSSYRLAQLSLLIGVGYWIGPIDLIPARTPYIGHLDEFCAVVGSLVIARFLAPEHRLQTHTRVSRPGGLATTRRRLPNFFIVGAARCGTTSLFQALGQHPDVFCCPVKEPNYFCTDRNAKLWVIQSAKNRLVLLGREQPTPPRLPRVATTVDIDTYESLFSGWEGQCAAGEASTAYLLSEDAARNIADACPDARIIIVLRQPVARAQSEYLMHQQLGRSPADLAWAVRARGALPEGELEALASIVGGSLYAPQIARYLAEFPREQILFLLFEDVLRDPSGALARIFAHIGVSPAAGAGIALSRENESRAVRSAGLNSILFRSGMRETILHLMPRRLRQALARRYYRAESIERPDIPASLFEADITQTEVLIGRDLTVWRA